MSREARDREPERNWIEKLQGLDVNKGLAYCGGREVLYKDMLLSFVQKEKLEDIHAFYEIRDWKNYEVLVKALEETSDSIGATELAGQAGMLKIAAKEENHYYLESHHKDVMKQYQELLLQLHEVLVGKKQEEEEEHYETEAHVLVVDDDEMNLKLAEHILGKFYTVSGVNSAREALRLLEKGKTDLLLLDLHMPDIDGFEMIQLLQEQEKYKGIPVVLLTADNDREIEVKGFKAGAQDFITKPFIPEIMIQRVDRILEFSRLQKDLQKEVERQTRRAEARRRRLERLTHQTMQTLADTIDAKDAYTNGHSVRVAKYVKEIAKRAGKSEKEQERIYYMGMLHDIGKIGIPDYIITKNSGLSEEEYALTRSHPVIGAEILENISEIPKLGIGARWHHERYDGGGYPDGLAGEEIPEEARMIAVADAYDAMASKRSYRDVLAQEVAYYEIEKGMGTQFDPVFAKIMLEMIREDKEYNMREK